MYCPRLDHFVRFNPNGTVSRCGHMTGSPQFATLEEMESSEWLLGVKDYMSRDQWPMECERCMAQEMMEVESVREHSLVRHPILSNLRSDYLVVGGVLDNICNSACLFCSSELSTTIGSLEKKVIKINNANRIDLLPKERIVEIDLNGGEPSYSENYQNLLANIPKNVKIIRINTNATKVLDLTDLLKTKKKIIVTISIDGVGKTFEYVRWPITWQKFDSNVRQYKKLSKRYTNLKIEFWSTLNALTLVDLDSMLKYADDLDIPLSYARITEPEVLRIEYSNPLTRKSDLEYSAVWKDNTGLLLEFLYQQDQLRGTNYMKYIGEHYGK